MLSEKFCMVLETCGVIRKVLLPKEKHGHVYHLDLELSDIDSGLVTHWQIALGVGEPTKARYMGVIGITSDDCHT